MRRNRYTIVHVHTPIASVLGRVAARLSGVPVIIYTAHGFYFHDRMQRALRRLLVWIERFLGRLCTDFLLTVSCEDRDTAIRERIIPAERVLCLKSVGVNLGRFNGIQPSGELRSSLGLLPDDKVLCFIGRLVKEKGVLDLVEAMPRIRREVANVKLLVVGEALQSDRAGDTDSRLAAIIQESALEGAVIFAGYREDIPALLAMSDVFVLPSYREGMPVTALEAMAARKPVVATNIRGCREEVINGVTGRLVPTANPAVLGDTIAELLLDPDRAARMGEAGRKRVETEFDERRVIAEQVALYRRLLERTNRGSLE
jgi:glycosyltransferase involved in cell wall biosynthesis